MAATQVPGAVVPAEATVDSRPDLFGTRGQLRPDGDGGMTSYMLGDRPEYATPDASQLDSGFYVGDRGLPWHVTLARQLGELDLMADAGQLLTAKEAVKAAGADWDVALRPIAVAESGLIVPGVSATIRTDTGAPLGVVGRTYRPFQNLELAELATNIVDAGGGLFETGGLMRGGKWFFLSMELAGLDIVVPGDPSALQTYLLLFTSHDGSRPASYRITTVRTVCKNTLDLAFARSVSSYRIRHSGNLAGKVEQARAALGIAFRHTEFVKDLTAKLSTAQVVEAQVREILNRTWPSPAVVEGDKEPEASRHIERALALYEASPNLDGIRGTAWGAVNAVTEYLDHEVVYRGRGRLANDEARANNLLFGEAHEAKGRAVAAALAVTK